MKHILLSCAGLSMLSLGAHASPTLDYPDFKSQMYALNGDFNILSVPKLTGSCTNPSYSLSQYPTSFVDSIDLGNAQNHFELYDDGSLHHFNPQSSGVEPGTRVMVSVNLKCDEGTTTFQKMVNIDQHLIYTTDNESAATWEPSTFAPEFGSKENPKNVIMHTPDPSQPIVPRVNLSPDVKWDNCTFDLPNPEHNTLPVGLVFDKTNGIISGITQQEETKQIDISIKCNTSSFNAYSIPQGVSLNLVVKKLDPK